jgi:NADPH2:quinone reductase
MQALWTAMRRGKRVVVGYSANNSKDDLLLIRQLIEAGEIRPVVDRAYRLRDIADAHRYVETGRKRGGVVVSVDVAA